MGRYTTTGKGRRQTDFAFRRSRSLVETPGKEKGEMRREKGRELQKKGLSPFRRSVLHFFSTKVFFSKRHRPVRDFIVRYPP
jgi:hypothetical protein